MNLSLPGPTDFPPGFYTLAEGILISVRNLQRSEGEVFNSIK